MTLSQSYFTYLKYRTAEPLNIFAEFIENDQYINDRSINQSIDELIRSIHQLID